MAGRGNNHPVLRTLVTGLGAATGLLTGFPILGKVVSRAGGAIIDRQPGTPLTPRASLDIREQLPYVGSNVRDAQFSPGALYGAPSRPPIGSPFNSFLSGPGGITRETFQIPMPGTQVRDISTITPLGQVGFRDQNGQMHYTGGNNAASFAAQAAGGASQGGGIGYGWTGIDGAAARSMFGGMAQASSDAIKQSEYSKFVRNNKR